MAAPAVALLPTAVPEVLGEGASAEGYPWPWSVYRWLPGEIPEAGALTEPVPLARDLAAFVTAMRDITLPDAPKAYRGRPLATLDAPTRAALDELRACPRRASTATGWRGCGGTRSAHRPTRGRPAGCTRT